MPEILDIFKEPHPRLHTRATPVKAVTPEILQLIQQMIHTMHAASGVGLAANQVGSGWDILVASPDGHPGRELVLINASLEEPRGAVCQPEGCLSVPGVSAEVRRWARVRIKGLNLRGEPITLEAEGLLARILQHETDHLCGHLFLDRLGFFKKRKLLKEYEMLQRQMEKVSF